VIITAGKITKSIPIVATTAEKKIVEIPIIFNFVSTDYSDKVVAASLLKVNESYKNYGAKNITFVLATVDNNGLPLVRKGVKFWNYKGVATDAMDYKTLWPKNKFAVNIYLLKNYISVSGLAAGTSSAYSAPGENLIIISQINEDIDLNVFGFWQITHEMGHILGLADVYNKADGVCKVQDGVDDIEGFNSKNAKINLEKNTYISNCGKEFSYSNIMANGLITKTNTMTQDQLKIVRKTALNFKL
jgi:hypothetical protein